MARNIPSVFLRFPEGRSKALTFSYDDGMYLDRRLIEILDANGLKGTFNIDGGRFAAEEGFDESNPQQRMTKEQFCKTFIGSHHEVASHGFTHSFLDALPPAGIAHEVLHDRETLETLLGQTVHGFAYPYGACNDRVVAVLRDCGILYARLANSSLNFDLPADWLRWRPTCHHTNPRTMELAKQFVEMRVYDHPKLFCLWGHTFEFGQDNNWSLVEEFASLVANREDIWYATNIEIFQYMRDFSRLEYSADCAIIHNPTARTLYFSLGFSDIRSIAPGETLKI